MIIFFCFQQPANTVKINRDHFELTTRKENVITNLKKIFLLTIAINSNMHLVINLRRISKLEISDYIFTMNFIVNYQ